MSGTGSLSSSGMTFARLRRCSSGSTASAADSTAATANANKPPAGRLGGGSCGTFPSAPPRPPPTPHPPPKEKKPPPPRPPQPAPPTPDQTEGATMRSPNGQATVATRRSSRKARRTAATGTIPVMHFRPVWMTIANVSATSRRCTVNDALDRGHLLRTEVKTHHHDHDDSIRPQPPTRPSTGARRPRIFRACEDRHVHLIGAA